MRDMPVTLVPASDERLLRRQPDATRIAGGRRRLLPHQHPLPGVEAGHRLDQFDLCAQLGRYPFERPSVHLARVQQADTPGADQRQTQLERHRRRITGAAKALVDRLERTSARASASFVDVATVTTVSSPVVTTPGVVLELGGVCSSHLRGARTRTTSEVR